MKLQHHKNQFLWPEQRHVKGNKAETQFLIANPDYFGIYITSDAFAIINNISRLSYDDKNTLVKAIRDSKGKNYVAMPSRDKRFDTILNAQYQCDYINRETYILNDQQRDLWNKGIDPMVKTGDVEMIISAWESAKRKDGPSVQELRFADYKKFSTVQKLHSGVLDTSYSYLLYVKMGKELFGKIFSYYHV
jgi:hypothetical protein